MKIASVVVKLNKEASGESILSKTHVPNKTHWDLAVKKALQEINTSSSQLVKVFLIPSADEVSEIVLLLSCSIDQVFS